MCWIEISPLHRAVSVQCVCTICYPVNILVASLLGKEVNEAVACRVGYRRAA